jgi:hypothetical protein
VERWRKAHSASVFSKLVPVDTQVGSIWESYTGAEVKWWDTGVGRKAAHPLLVAAVFYRTVTNLEVVQVSWRSWWLVSIDDDGDLVSCIPDPTTQLKPDRLHVEPFHQSMFHDEYAPVVEKPKKEGKAEQA